MNRNHLVLNVISFSKKSSKLAWTIRTQSSLDGAVAPSLESKLFPARKGFKHGWSRPMAVQAIHVHVFASPSLTQYQMLVLCPTAQNQIQHRSHLKRCWTYTDPIRCWTFRISNLADAWMSAEERRGGPDITQHVYRAQCKCFHPFFGQFLGFQQTLGESISVDSVYNDNKHC